MSRPIRYCALCGHFVADGLRSTSPGRPHASGLIHVDADGREVNYLAHRPIEETDETRGASANRLAQLRQEGKIQ